MADKTAFDLEAAENDPLLHLTFGQFCLLSFGLGSIGTAVLVLPFIIYEWIFK